MSRITCKEAADAIIEQYGFKGLKPENFNDRAPDDVEYVEERLERAAFTYVEALSDEGKFWVWHTCDNSLNWQEGLYFYGPESRDKSKWLEGLSGWAVYLTIKTQALQGSTAV